MLTIARDLNLQGYKTNRGCPFELRGVQRILVNRFYVGDVTWNGITFHGTHETIPAVTSVFESVQARIQSEYQPVTASRPLPLLIGCLDC